MNKFVTPGIKDENFIRGEVPMTKEEVRIISLSKLALEPDSILYDIGAGTGSITVEAARLIVDGRVLAVEKEAAAVALIKQNLLKFGCRNVKLVEGAAPDCLNSLPSPDRVFIGGSGENLASIFNYINDRLEPGGRIVANAVTMETTYEIISLLEQKNYNVGAVNINFSSLKKVGRKHIWQAANPIAVIWGVKEE